MKTDMDRAAVAAADSVVVNRLTKIPEKLRDLGWLLPASTIFCGAFLLFQVEPMIAKAILPWFGGSAQVWTTCLLFFQAALLAGYLYAHILSQWVRPAWQLRIHVTLLMFSLALLPILPSDRWKPMGGEDPLALILGLLAATIGLPFTMLSATSSLVQAWLARASHPDGTKARAPYRLFALSNLGSMLALLSYPVLVEPNLAIRTQAWSWSMGYGLFVVLSVATAWQHRSGSMAIRDTVSTPDANAPSWADRALWFALAAAPSALLLTLTNYMLQNIAAIPLLWVLPLALYLLSFIFAFGSLRWYNRSLWYQLFIAAVAGIVFAMSGGFTTGNLVLLPLLAGVLFVMCMVCHAELASSRPPSRYLTGYYLSISAGGAAGGLFVAAFAPAVFNATYELPILIPLTILLVILAGARNYDDWAPSSRRSSLLASAMFFFCITTFFMARSIYLSLSGEVLLARNFYGAVKVTDFRDAAGDERRRLSNGTIDHGQEFVAPAKQRQPLAYFSHISGIGIALDELGTEGPLNVGVIGLGTGTLAAYGRAGDTYRIYEINPVVAEIARNDFWYLGTSPAQSNIVLGDARLSLEREPLQHFDVLVVDAFSSDAIPIHLLTREAMALYWRHLKPDGVLAVHVSNRYVDLAPVVALLAAESGKTARVVRNDADEAVGIHPSRWVLVTSRPGFFDRAALRNAAEIAVSRRSRVWTDDYNNLWQILHLNF